MYLKNIVQNCLINLNEERTIYSSYHIIKGRKSVQTAQDIQVYQLTKYFKLLPELTEKEFSAVIQRLIQEKIIKVRDEKGWYDLYEQESKPDKLYFNSYAYSEVTQIFMNRLLLLVQALLNYQVNNSKYIPVIDELGVKSFVRNYFRRRKKYLIQDKRSFHKELNQGLEQCDPLHSYLFVQRFTGANHIGKSMHQLAFEANLTKIDLKLILVSLTQRLIYLSLNSPDKYPRLNDLLSDLIHKPKLTKSAQITYERLNRSNDLEWIADQRRLKLSTIYDHVIEITLKDPLFSIRPFIDEYLEDKIKQTIKRKQTYKLKEIKTHLPEEVSYFQIRLVLSRLNRSEDIGT